MTMMNDPDIMNFLTASSFDRYQMAVDDSLAPKLKTYLGDAAYQELRDLAAKALGTRKKRHLAPAVPPNLIFVPGVMGSLLLSSKMGGVWWVDMRTRKHIDDLRLAPDGQKDADPATGIMPCTVDTTYEPFFVAVNEQDDFNHEIFAYDWRKPLELSAGALRDKVNETYANNGNERVHLVAHSMGGLMIRTALLKHGAEIWPKIDRIIFLGTPHYGSPAIAGYLKNHLWGFELMALLGLYLGRDTFRSLWGVLSMLPAPRGIYPGTRQNDPAPWAGGKAGDPYVHPCANFNIYDAKEWDLGISTEQTDQLQKALDNAARFHQQLYESHLALNQDQRDGMAVIAGVGYKTLFRLAYEEHFWGAWTSTDKVTGRITGDPHRDGDGRVPLASATLEDVGEIRYVKGVHGDLPMTQEVYEDVFRWLNKEPMELPTSPGAALKTHLAGGPAGVSDAPNLTRTTDVDHVTGDPGFWDVAPPDQQRLAQFDALLQSEQLPEFNKIRLL